MELIISYDKDNKVCGYILIVMQKFFLWTFVRKFTIVIGTHSIDHSKSIGNFKKVW